MSTKNNKPKSYKRNPKKIEIKFEDENGAISTNHLIQLNGTKGGEWKSFARTKMDKDGFITDYKDYHATLVQMSLWSDDKNKFWTMEEVNDLPDEIVLDLHKECQYLNGWDVRPEDQEKDDDDNPKGELPVKNSTGTNSQSESVEGQLPS